MSDVASVFAIIFYTIAAVSLVLLARNYFKDYTDLEKSDREFFDKMHEFTDDIFALVHDVEDKVDNFEDKVNKFEVEFDANLNDQKKRIDRIYQKWSEVNRKVNLLDESLSRFNTRILALETRLEGAVMIVNANDSIIVEPPDETFKITNADNELFMKDTPLSDIFDERNVKPVEEVKED